MRAAELSVVDAGSFIEALLGGEVFLGDVLVGECFCCNEHERMCRNGAWLLRLESLSNSSKDMADWYPRSNALSSFGSLGFVSFSLNILRQSSTERQIATHM